MDPVSSLLNVPCSVTFPHLLTHDSTERAILITQKQHRLSLRLLSLGLVLPSRFETSDGTKKQYPLGGSILYFSAYSASSPVQSLRLEILAWSSIPLSLAGLD